MGGLIPFDRSETALQRMFSRVATQMQVNPADVDVTLFVMGHELTRSLVPFYSGKSSGAGGLYHHDAAAKPHISINEAQLKDPMTLVAVLAHELGTSFSSVRVSLNVPTRKWSN